MAQLRDPRTGCPWDVEQDFASIAPYTSEEAHEVADAIDRQAWAELPGELGDLLLQVVFHAQMADEAGMFDFADCAAAISEKLVFRHPHVFGTENRDKSAEQQVKDWEAIKAKVMESVRNKVRSQLYVSASSLVAASTSDCSSAVVAVPRAALDSSLGAIISSTD